MWRFELVLEDSSALSCNSVTELNVVNSACLRPSEDVRRFTGQHLISAMWLNGMIQI